MNLTHKQPIRITGKIIWYLGYPGWRLLLNGSERVYVVLVKNKEILLVKNWLGLQEWQLPGGGLNKHESAEVAAAREIKEELGVVLTPGNFKQITSSQINNHGIKFLCHMLSAELPDDSVIKLNFETVELKWIKLGDLKHQEQLSDFVRLVTDKIVSVL